MYFFNLNFSNKHKGINSFSLINEKELIKILQCKDYNNVEEHPHICTCIFVRNLK